MLQLLTYGSTMYLQYCTAAAVGVCACLLVPACCCLLLRLLLFSCSCKRHLGCPYANIHTTPLSAAAAAEFPSSPHSPKGPVLVSSSLAFAPAHKHLCAGRSCTGCGSFFYSVNLLCVYLHIKLYICFANYFFQHLFRGCIVETTILGFTANTGILIPLIFTKWPG